MDNVKPISFKTLLLIYIAASIPLKNLLLVTSKYASSIERGSTSCVTSLKIANILLDISLYLWYLTLTKCPFGHNLWAIKTGIADFTPNFLASYEHVETTPRSLTPPTITGLPLSCGLSNCSTEAKKASISTCKIILCIITTLT